MHLTSLVSSSPRLFRRALPPTRPPSGYSLPVLYETDAGGVVNEHMATRNAAGLFDVSHMGQIRWYGKDRIKFLESILVGDIQVTMVQAH